jgi:polyhydroxyalkanoate synthesis regulator phasin
VSEGPEKASDRKVAEALRDAVERTLQATAGSAASTRERASDLLDEVTRRSRDAREELTRRGQEAGVEIARRGQGASAELARRLGELERRLASVEDSLSTEHSEGNAAPAPAPAPGRQGESSEARQSEPKAEG